MPRVFALFLLTSSIMPAAAQERARTLGIVPGMLQPGPRNAITDVPGVLVGQSTIVRGDSIRTGVTAILPHGGNLFFDRVPAAVFVGNGFGKLLGSTQVNELGELETPILLTCTLCVWKAADALVAHLLQQPGMDQVRSINPVVGETNDGRLNAIRHRAVEPDDVRAALATADRGPVAEGSVGAGTGTVAFGWKGGIGTSSRIAASGDNRWTVGVLVQSNFGGDLRILGVPVMQALGRKGLGVGLPGGNSGGSIMIVVATDAPLSHRNLHRLAERSLLGVGRTGSVMDNGSGDYAIAFSTAAQLRRRQPRDGPRQVIEVENDKMSPLFQAVVESTEEAIYNSLFMARTVESRSAKVEALPVSEVLTILRNHRALP